MTGNRPALLVLVLVLASACSSSSGLIVGDDLPEGAPKGYVEVYCSFCLANVTVLRRERDQETHVANLAKGHTMVSALQSPAKPPRLLRVRVAQPLGEQVYVVKLLSRELGGGLTSAWATGSEGLTSTRVTGNVQEDMVTPIRIHFIPETRSTFSWHPVVGSPIPLTASPDAIESIYNMLFDSDWGTRWYAIDILSSMPSALENRAMSRLIELSQSDSYEQCLEHDTPLDCSLVRDRAHQALETEQRKSEQ